MLGKEEGLSDYETIGFQLTREFLRLSQLCPQASVRQRPRDGTVLDRQLSARSQIDRQWGRPDPQTSHSQGFPAMTC